VAPDVGGEVVDRSLAVDPMAVGGRGEGGTPLAAAVAMGRVWLDRQQRLNEGGWFHLRHGRQATEMCDRLAWVNKAGKVSFSGNTAPTSGRYKSW
jgi:hypothetical protein